jgi:hypothetical protein
VAPSRPRVRAPLLIALVLTNLVLIVWATAQLFADLSSAPISTNRVEPLTLTSVVIAAPHSPGARRNSRPVATNRG